MTSAEHDDPDAGLSSKDMEDMKKYDITRAPADYFFVGNYRYTNLADAIAQAKRQRARGSNS